MSRLPPRNRDTIKYLNDRENFNKIIKSREFNLERQKELKKIIQDQTKLLYAQQQKKVKKIKQGRGKNLRGELTRNRNLQRRFEAGERRYKETEEPRIVGDAAPIIIGQPATVAPEDKEIARHRLRIEEGAARGKLQLQLQQQQQEHHYRQGQLAVSNESNRLKNLEIDTDRAIRAEENAIKRLELQARQDNIEIENIPATPPTNIADTQFFGNLLTGLAQDKQREREHTENIMRELLEHQRRTAGAVDNSIIHRLFDYAQQTGQRVQGEGVNTRANPAPPSTVWQYEPAPSVISLGDRPPTSISDVASEVRSILRNPNTQSQHEGSQRSVGVFTAINNRLAIEGRPIWPVPRVDTDMQDRVQDFLEGAEEDAPSEQGTISSITSSEWHRRTGIAEAEFDKTEEGLANLLEAQRFNEENPYAFLEEVENPLDDLDLSPSEMSRFMHRAEEAEEAERGELGGSSIAEELQALSERELATSTIKSLESVESELEQEQIAIGHEQEIIEEGAGVGVLEQAGGMLGGVLAQVAGGVASGVGGIIQGAGEAVIEQLPTPAQVGQTIGRGAIAGTGAILSGAAGLAQGAIEQIVGQGVVEDVIEDIEVAGGATDEGEQLEEVPISILNPAEVADNQFDYGKFMIHHGEQSSKRGRQPAADRIATQYAIQNTSDRDHKKLTPGQQVDITSYRADANLGDSIGYRGGAGSLVGATGRENTLKLTALNKSIDKGFLKLIEK